jgi:hypothetical protein
VLVLEIVLVLVLEIARHLVLEIALVLERIARSSSTSTAFG